MTMTLEQIDHAERATERARAVLKPGDWLTVRNCGNSRSRVRMTGWDRDWVCSRKRSDIHALHVLKVNGEPVGFDDLSYQAAECIWFGDSTIVPDVYGGIATTVSQVLVTHSPDFSEKDLLGVLERAERRRLEP